MRRATAADAADVGRLLHDFNTEFDSFTPGAEVVGQRAGALIERGEALVLLAGEGPDGVAVIRLRPAIFNDGNYALLEELYVAPSLRGRGLGRALLEAAMDAARERGAVFMEIGTSEDDTAARGLYESAGFVNSESGPDGPPSLLYEREL